MRTAGELTTGNVLSRLVSFLLPFLFSSFMQAFYGAVDMWTIGHFSTTANLAAVNIGAQATQIVLGFCIGMTTGTTVMIGHSVGAKNKEGAALAVGNSVWLFLFLAAIFTPIAVFGANAITAIMKAPEGAVAGASTYIRICGAGIPFIIAYNVISAILRGDGNSYIPMVFIGIACVVNVIGDLLLTGVLGLGVTGVAVATVSAQAVSSVIGMIYLWKKGLSFPITKQGFRLTFGNGLKNIVFVGLPIAVQEIVIILSFVAITVVANTREIADASAVGVVGKIINLMFLFPSAMMAALSAFTSQNVGAGKHERAVLALKYGIFMAFVFGAVCCTLSQFIGRSMVSLFSSDVEVICSSAQYLSANSFDCVLVAFIFCLNGYAGGIGKSFIVFVHSVISSFGVRLPLAVLLSHLYPGNMFPMGCASPIGSVVSLAICAGYLMWMKKTGRLTYVAQERR